MMMGRTWNANTAPRDPLDLAEGVAKHECAAVFGVTQHRGDSDAGGLKQFADAGLQNDDRETELQAEAPEQNSQFDGAFVARKQPRDRQDRDQTKQACKPAHQRGPQV